MKRLLLAIPIIICLLLVWVFLNFLSVKKTNDLYSYIPYDAEQVIQFNTNQLFKKIAFERIFHEESFTKKITFEESPGVFSTPTGIDFTHPLTIFKEFHGLGPLWVFMLKVDNQSQLESYLDDKVEQYPYAYNEEVFLVGIPFGPNTDSVKTHLQNIINKNITPHPKKDIMIADLGKDLFDISFIISNHIKGNLLNIKSLDGGLIFLEKEIALNADIQMKDNFKLNPTDKVFVLPPRGIHIHGFLEPKDFINAVIQDMPFIKRLPQTRYFSLNIIGFDFEFGNSPEKKFDIHPKIELLVKPGSFNEYESFMESLRKDSLVILDEKKQIITIPNRFSIYYDLVGDMLYFSTLGKKKVELEEIELKEIASLSINVNEVIENINLEIPFARIIKSQVDALKDLESISFKLMKDENDPHHFKSEGKILFKDQDVHSIIGLVSFIQTLSDLEIVQSAMRTKN